MSPAIRRPTDFPKIIHNELFLLNIYMLRRNSKIENLENLNKIGFVYTKSWDLVKVKHIYPKSSKAYY